MASAQASTGLTALFNRIDEYNEGPSAGTFGKGQQPSMVRAGFDPEP